MRREVEELGFNIRYLGNYPESIVELRDDLKSLTRELDMIINHLSLDKPTEGLALIFGIRDNSYMAINNKLVKSFEGVTYINMLNGTRWKAIGKKHGINNDRVFQGYIEFKEIL